MTEAISLDLPGGVGVLVRPEVLAHFDAHRQRSCLRREAGGQLFAKISGKSWEIIIATGPRKSDWRSRFGYRPNRQAEIEEIERHYSDELHFVGDWHTHPQKVPRPSDTDIWSMNDAAAQSIHELPGFLMFIVGTRPFPAGLWASFHSGRGPAIVLEPAKVSEAPATPIA